MADAADAGRGQPALLTLSRFCFAMYASCKSGFSSASFFSSDSVLPIWPDNEMLCEIEKYFLPAMPEARAAGTALGFVPCLGLGLTLSVPQFPHLSMELSEYPPHGGRGNGKRSAQARCAVSAPCGPRACLSVPFKVSVMNCYVKGREGPHLKKY